MIDDLKRLINLQALDNRIHELELQKKEFPQSVEKLKEEMKKAEVGAEHIASEIAEIGNEKKALNEQVAQASTLLGRSQERLRMIKTNKEYDAVHQEIETNKRTVSTAEKRLSNMAGDEGRLSEQLQQARGEMDKIKTQNDPQISEMQSKISGIDAQIAEVTKERDALITTISKHVIRMYDYIRSRRKSAHILATVSESGRSCSICHKILEMQLINEVRRGTRIINCESCGSILIWTGGDAPLPPPPQPKPRTEQAEEGPLLPSEREESGAEPGNEE
jgi:predicted  nucleic acid-binding Zn-ribbon protein